MNLLHPLIRRGNFPVRLLLLFIVCSVSNVAWSENKSTCDPKLRDCLYDGLSPSACVGANGYLKQVNIASVINLQPSSLNVLVQYLDQNGVPQGSVAATVSPSVKQDFIVNDIGLKPDSIGTVCVFTNATGNGAWTGGVTIYKPDLSVSFGSFFDSIEFALYYPFVRPSNEPEFASINTYHIGTAPNSVIANWIAVSDATPGDGFGLSGEMKYFGQDGQFLRAESVNMLDGGRADLSGHDGLTGNRITDAVGVAEFVPAPRSDGTQPEYYFTTTRYFYNCAGASCSNFLAAFNLPFRPATTAPIFGGVSTELSEVSIVEILNSGATGATAQVNVVNGLGLSAANVAPGVAPLGAFHVIASSVLGANSLGSAVVQSASPISATSLFYQVQNSVLQYAYAAPLTGPASQSQLLQFNSFAKQENEVELYNSNGFPVVWHVMALDYAGVPMCTTRGQALGSYATTRFTLPKSPETYGTVLVKSSNDGLIARSYVQRPNTYTLTFPGNPTSPINENAFPSLVSCIYTPPPDVVTPIPTPTPGPSIPTPTPKPTPPAGNSCGPKRTCGEMSNCAEAYHYLRDCGIKRLDGDNDGVPCESICH